ncbi:MAG: DoxX family protein [Bacteroidota bacterium]|jgi:uncharacterized membrane protein
MNKTKLIYWVTTGLFSAFMIFTAVPNIMMDAASKQLITDYLGYPEYFIPFIGLAKILGGLAILVPYFKKIKEWAYAGLAFDLIGAMYSAIKVGGIDPGMSIMILVFAAGITSYIYNQKVYKA